MARCLRLERLGRLAINISTQHRADSVKRQCCELNAAVCSVLSFPVRWRHSSLEHVQQQQQQQQHLDWRRRRDDVNSRVNNRCLDDHYCLRIHVLDDCLLVTIVIVAKQHLELQMIVADGHGTFYTREVNRSSFFRQILTNMLQLEHVSESSGLIGNLCIFDLLMKFAESTICWCFRSSC